MSRRMDWDKARASSMPSLALTSEPDYVAPSRSQREPMFVGNSPRVKRALAWKTAGIKIKKLKKLGPRYGLTKAELEAKLKSR